MSHHRPLSNHLRDSQQPNRTGNTRLDCLLKREIERYQKPGIPWLHAAHPWFPPKLEHRFEADTRSARVRELKFAIILGAIFYYGSAVTDPILVPDLGLGALWLRSIDLPLILFLIAAGPRLPNKLRESICAFTVVLGVTLLAIIPTLSAAPLAPFAFTTAMLALIYANTTIVLRFHNACAMTAFCGMVIVVLAVSREGVDEPLGWAIGCQAIIAALFSIVTNYRIEWNARLSYLLSVRKAARLRTLAADREALRLLSRTDELTGLFNRGWFNRQCEKMFADPECNQLPAALLMIDVDHFKRYNDYYGHIAGDECLRAVAQRISQTVRGEHDLVARYGGEEFVVLLRGVTPAHAELLAERICTAVSELGMAHDNRCDGLTHVTISVGIATVTIGEGSSLKNLIDASDRCLYAAKRKGRNRTSALASVA